LNIEFLGRIDNQTKIRGFRIELAEIENTIKNYKVDAKIKTILNDDILNQWNPQKVKRCTRCLLTSASPGVHLNQDGVCSVCLEYEGYEMQASKYFKTRDDLRKQIEKAKQEKKQESQYDCLLLFSGGKDSSYVLYQLVEMGFKVLTFTFDNGYISSTAFSNIKQITEKLNVKNIIRGAENTDEVFVESIKSNHSVCHGCWNALNAVGTKVAGENHINIVISGLSRGQIFDMKLYGLFQLGIFDENEIDQRLLIFRKSFHSRDNKFARLLKVEDEKERVEEIHFLDFFRYDDVPVHHIKAYLLKRGWIQPGDTGFCSSNCKINDVGIYMHLRETGCHFYEAPLSWDCRLGVISRQEGLREIVFNGNPEAIDSILKKIGFYNSTVVSDAVVVDREDKNGDKYLCAYYLADTYLDEADLKEYLSRFLPAYMIPTFFIRIEKIPLTMSGKIDKKALPEPEIRAKTRYVSPETYEEKNIAAIWEKILRLEKPGINDNFFDIGGNSINIIQLFFELKNVFQLEIPVAKIFQYPTIASFARYLQDNNEFISNPAKENQPSQRLEQVRKRLQQRKGRGKRIKEQGGKL
jgi:acyl carrier protein